MNPLFAVSGLVGSRGTKALKALVPRVPAHAALRALLRRLVHLHAGAVWKTRVAHGDAAQMLGGRSHLLAGGAGLERALNHIKAVVALDGLQEGVLRLAGTGVQRAGLDPHRKRVAVLLPAGHGGKLRALAGGGPGLLHEGSKTIRRGRFEPQKNLARQHLGPVLHRFGLRHHLGHDHVAPASLEVDLVAGGQTVDEVFVLQLGVGEQGQQGEQADGQELTGHGVPPFGGRVTDAVWSGRPVQRAELVVVGVAQMPGVSERDWKMVTNE